MQRIALGWWKLGRACRYENAEIAVQLFVRHSKGEVISSDGQARLALLKKVELETEATGKLSEEFKRSISAMPNVQGCGHSRNNTSLNT